ncbi:MAG: hypothetical protein IPJ57_20670 [Gemmatimonadetes bacterium]|nr:hypothetical protein [Gemmatimonadota bacterium]
MNMSAFPDDPGTSSAGSPRGRRGRTRDALTPRLVHGAHSRRCWRRRSTLAPSSRRCRRAPWTWPARARWRVLLDDGTTLAARRVVLPWKPPAERPAARRPRRVPLLPQSPGTPPRRPPSRPPRRCCSSAPASR